MINSKHFQKLNNFVEYFNSFYGVDGIYSHNRNYTLEDIVVAMDLLFQRKPEYVFEGDSVDRELLRDMMLDSATMIKRFQKQDSAIYWNL
jgi:hypothetical protein